MPDSDPGVIGGSDQALGGTGYGQLSARDFVPVPAHTSLFVVRTPKAKASFFSLKDYRGQVGKIIL